MSNMEKFSEFLREVYEKSEINSIRELARRADMDHSYLSLILKGKKPNPPSPEIINKLSKALDVDYNKMMVLAGYIKPENKENVYHDFLSFYSLFNEMDNKLKKLNFDYLKAIDKAIEKNITPEELLNIIENS